MTLPQTRDFVWRDAGRTVVFRAGALDAAPGLLADHGFDSFELLSTQRALGDAPDLAAAAAGAVHEVPPGAVPDIAAELLDRVSAERLVALGGGRVIDTAKAIAAVSGAAVAAIPTTLSGAEMTGVHRLPAGAEQRARGLVRPDLVLADPGPMTSAPEQPLRASAMNALAHGADSLYTPFANPMSELAALRGAGLIAAALDADRDSREHSQLALGSILCGYAFDSGLFAIHHVICQTLVRILEIPHAETNAAILPRAMEAMRERAPRQIAALAEAIGTDASSIGERIAELAGEQRGLGELGADRERLDEALDGIEARPELGFTPDPPGRAEIQGIIDSAW
ncbi:MAG: iron-containing alcohol dehydrogenase [Actinomycetota bacterium]